MFKILTLFQKHSWNVCTADVYINAHDLMMWQIKRCSSDAHKLFHSRRLLSTRRTTLRIWVSLYMCFCQQHILKIVILHKKCEIPGKLWLNLTWNNLLRHSWRILVYTLFILPENFRCTTCNEILEKMRSIQFFNWCKSKIDCKCFYSEYT